LASKLLFRARVSKHPPPDKKEALVKVKFLARCLILCIALGMAAGCGKQDPEADSLRVLVQIPEGERPELFWFGVERKELEVKQGDEAKAYPWNTGQAVEIDLSEGDGLVFRAFDREGRLLVTGEAIVGGAKMVSIPLRRVL
jgi:hypothetical protein